MKLSTAAAAGVLLLAGCTGQQPSSQQAATTTPVLASSTPLASSPASAGMVFEDIEPGAELEPGTYVLNYSSIGGAEAYPTLAVTFNVPSSGWQRVMVDGLVWNDNGTRLAIVVVDGIYADPCDPGAGVLKVGPLVTVLTSALLAYPGWEDALATDVSLAGYKGQRVELNAGADASCFGEAAQLFHTLGSPGFTMGPGNGDLHELYILDVDGTRLVIVAITEAEASADDRAALHALLDSIEIQP
jgi:hypothetical protein